jgi:hypothetical protein
MPVLVEASYVEATERVQPNRANSYDNAHGGEVVKLMDELAAIAAMVDAERAGLSFLGDSPDDGLGPYRRAFVAPEGHVGVPFEFVETR